jgi:hypothetical protein
VNDDQQDDQTPAAPRETKPWELRGGRARLLWLRAQREANNSLIGVRQPKLDEDPVVERAVREGHCVTEYDPFD